MKSEATQRVALSRLYELARAEVRDALRLAQLDDPASIADVVSTFVPVIADRYGLAAGVLAAQWYEEQRAAAEVAGYFQAEPAALPDAGRYEALGRWAATKNDVEALVSGGVQRVIADAHRQTVMQASFADPQAKGWARFGRGAETCTFCHMLISRGGVYTDTSAKFGAHDHCDCGAGPIWKGRAGAEKVSAYRKSARRREDATGAATGATAADQARAREWIAANL